MSSFYHVLDEKVFTLSAHNPGIAEAVQKVGGTPASHRARTTCAGLEEPWPWAESEPEIVFCPFNPSQNRV